MSNVALSNPIRLGCGKINDLEEGVLNLGSTESDCEDSKDVGEVPHVVGASLISGVREGYRFPPGWIDTIHNRHDELAIMEKVFMGRICDEGVDFPTHDLGAAPEEKLSHLWSLHEEPLASDCLVLDNKVQAERGQGIQPGWREMPCDVPRSETHRIEDLVTVTTKDVRVDVLGRNRHAGWARICGIPNALARPKSGGRDTRVR